MKQLLTLNDVPDMAQMVQLASQLKSDPHAFSHLGSRKTIGLLFFNPSLRTRLSTQKAGIPELEQRHHHRDIVADLGGSGVLIERCCTIEKG